MALHVNSTHLDFLTTPECEVGDFLEDDEFGGGGDYSSIWELGRQICGISETYTRIIHLWLVRKHYSRNVNLHCLNGRERNLARVWTNVELRNLAMVEIEL